LTIGDFVTILNLYTEKALAGGLNVKVVWTRSLARDGGMVEDQAGLYVWSGGDRPWSKF